MIEKLPKPLHPEVQIIGTSSTFHLQICERKELGDGYKTVCGNGGAASTRSKITTMSIDEAIEDGKSVCKNCIKWGQRMYGLDVRFCRLCDKVNLVSDDEFRELPIEHESSGETRVHLCSSCISAVKKL